MPESKGPTDQNAPRPVQRREFLRLAGGAVAATVVTSCDGGTAPSGGGSVVVRVTGLAGTAAGSVTASIRPGGGSTPGISIPLPTPDASGVSVGTGVNIPPGEYRVTYNAPPHHLVLGPTNQQDVVVEQGAEPVRVAFAVQALGTLEVQVSGFSAGAPSAGVVAVALASGGPAGTTVVLPTPSGGAALGTNAVHPVGSYRVTHTAPAGYQHVGGDNIEDVTIGLGGVARASFQVQPSAAPTGLVFASDWRTARGTSQPAITDGGRWNLFGPGIHSAIVDGAPFNFPMPNILAIRHAGSWGGVTRPNGWTLPPIGGSLWFRLYFRMAVQPAVNFGTHHPVQHAPEAGSCAFSGQWMHDATTGSTFSFYLAYLVDGQAGNTALVHRPGVTLQRDTTYRIEWQHLRLTTTTWEIHARVYNAAGTLVRSDADFVCQEFSHNNHNLSSGIFATTPLPDCYRNFMIVNQGRWGTGAEVTAGEDRLFYGGFAVSQASWCGPWVPGEGASP